MKKVIKWSKEHIILLAFGSLIPPIPILLISGDMAIDPYLLCVQIVSEIFLLIAVYGIIKK